MILIKSNLLSYLTFYCKSFGQYLFAFMTSHVDDIHIYCDLDTVCVCIRIRMVQVHLAIKDNIV